MVHGCLSSGLNPLQPYLIFSTFFRSSTYSLYLLDKILLSDALDQTRNKVAILSVDCLFYNEFKVNVKK